MLTCRTNVLELLPCCCRLYDAVSAAAQIQLHLSSFVEGSPCRVACENLFAGNSWLVSALVLFTVAGIATVILLLRG